jgi:hypothetical protein
MNRLDASPDRTYITSMDPETVRDSLRYASDEAIQKIAKLLTDDQYEYAKRTLPSKASQALVKARLEGRLV